MNPIRKPLGLSLLSAAVIALLSVLANPATAAETTKGQRFDTAAQSVELKQLKTEGDFKSLSKGDKIVAYCPMIKKVVVTTVRNVDSKGRVKVIETKDGAVLDGCNIKLVRKPGSKEVSAVMVAKDGKAMPVECSVMKASS